MRTHARTHTRTHTHTDADAGRQARMRTHARMRAGLDRHAGAARAPGARDAGPQLLRGQRAAADPAHRQGGASPPDAAPARRESLECIEGGGGRREAGGTEVRREGRREGSRKGGGGWVPPVPGPLMFIRWRHHWLETCHPPVSVSSQPLVPARRPFRGSASSTEGPACRQREAERRTPEDTMTL